MEWEIPELVPLSVRRGDDGTKLGKDVDNITGKCISGSGDATTCLVGAGA